MKKLFFIIVLCLSGTLPGLSQTINESWDFYNLHAADDSAGTTHLYYHMLKTREYHCVSEYQSGIFSSKRNTVHHFNASSESDSTLIQVSGGVFPGECTGGAGIGIYDFHPFDGDPANSIFTGMYADGFEPYGYVQVGSMDFYLYPLFESFDKVFANPNLGDSFFIPRFNKTYQVPITQDQDTLNIINNYWHDIEYVDSLSNYVKTYDFQLLGLSQFDDSLSFYQREGGVYRSENLGRTEEQLNIELSTQSKFFFDADSLHIYLAANNQTLQISDKYGKLGSWNSKNLPSSTRFFAVDPQIPGLIFFADTNKVYKSTDHAENIELYNEFNKRIEGLYKKPGKDVLYVLFSDELVKIVSGEINAVIEPPSLKAVSLNAPSFPYETGNEFTFRIYELDNHQQAPAEDYKAVVADEVNHSEGGQQILIQNSSNRPLFNDLNFDSEGHLTVNNGFGMDGQLLLKNEQPQYEPWVAYSITDTAHLLGIYRGINKRVVFDEIHSTVTIDFFIPENSDTTARFGRETISANWSNTYGFRDVYVWEDSLRYFLKGAVIDGIVYGDTTRTLFVSNEPEPPHSDLPRTVELHHNYPNPFNPTTVIRYQLPENRNVTLEVFDITGRRVAVLIAGEFRSSGTHRVSFQAGSLSSGVYFYQLKAGDQTLTQKMTLIK